MKRQLLSKGAVFCYTFLSSMFTYGQQTLPSLIGVLTWLPFLFFLSILFGTFSLFLIYRTRPLLFRNLSIVIAVVVFFRISYASVLSILQYTLFAKDPVSKFLLPPYQPSQYFLSYTWTHFWFNVLLSLSAALGVYAFFSFLKLYRSSPFEEGETDLAFLLSLAVGWPYVVIFVPLAIVLTIMLSAFHLYTLHKRYTLIGIPLFLSALLTFFFGNMLIELLNLTVLKV